MGSKVAASERIAIYRPNQRHDLGWLATWRLMIQHVYESRELVWQLFKRDFFAVYKKSFIGITWVFIAPLIGILNWIFLQYTGLLDPGELDIPYPVYVMMGTSCWALFVGFYGSAKGTLSAGRGLVMQVNYHHEVLVFKTTAHQLANYLIMFAMNMIVISLFGVFPSWQTIFFPLVALPLFLLGAGLGMIGAILNIIAVDISRVDSRALALLVWATPIVYSNKVPNELVQTIIKWNPLTYLVCSARDIVLYGRLYDTTGYFICAVMSLVIFLISWRLFYVTEDKVIERMI